MLKAKWGKRFCFFSQFRFHKSRESTITAANSVFTRFFRYQSGQATVGLKAFSDKKTERLTRPRRLDGIFKLILYRVLLHLKHV